MKFVARAVWVATFAASATLLTGCGKSSNAKFCADAQAMANASPTDTPTGNQQAVEQLQRLRAESPRSLQKDFDILLRFARSQASSSPTVTSETDLKQVYEATSRISTYLTDKCNLATTSTT